MLAAHSDFMGPECRYINQALRIRRRGFLFGTEEWGPCRVKAVGRGRRETRNMPVRSLLGWTIVPILCLAASGCVGVPGVLGPPNSPEFSGIWQGSWTLDAAQGRAIAEFTQSGNNVYGLIEFLQPCMESCLPNAYFVGVIRGMTAVGRSNEWQTAARCDGSTLDIEVELPSGHLKMAMRRGRGWLSVEPAGLKVPTVDDP